MLSFFKFKTNLNYIILDSTELNVENIQSLVGTDTKYAKRRNRM